MTTSIHSGPRTWKLSRDEAGHRTYTLRILVDAGPDDGPAQVLQTTGLPTPGSFWEFRDDIDIYAYLKQNADVSIHQEKEGDSPRIYAVDLTYSTKPTKRCSEEQFEDPLLEPPKVSGGFVKYTEEATHDNSGAPITNSSWEPMKGPQLEFDRNRPNIKIVMNVADLQWDLVSGMLDTLNDAELWGFPTRCVKLSEASWEQKWWGQCDYYYTWNLSFDIRRETFDRYLGDEGLKALNGHWDILTGNWDIDNINGVPPDRFNPAHFIKVQDRKGNPMRVTLDGAGKPVAKKTGGEVEFANNFSPITVTSAAHGIANGNLVAIRNVKGNTNANGTWLARAVTTNTFELQYTPADLFWATIIYGYTDSTGNGDFNGELIPTWVNLSASGPGIIRVAKYLESNFLLLGIPDQL